MSNFKAVFFRYHVKRTEDFDSFQEALEFLEDGSDRNELSQIAIIWNGEISWVNSFYSKEYIEEECKEFLLTKTG